MEQEVKNTEEQAEKAAPKKKSKKDMPHLKMQLIPKIWNWPLPLLMN